MKSESKNTGFKPKLVKLEANENFVKYIFKKLTKSLKTKCKYQNWNLKYFHFSVFITGQIRPSR